MHLPEPLVKYAYMKTLKQRTEEALAEGFTVGQLAAAAGKTSAAASQWLKGTTKTIKADSAIGLEKLTGWSWVWWATGKGDRGDTKRAGDAPVRTPLQEALAVLGAALAQDLPDDVRQDVADLLAKFALRRGALRHQDELAELLRGENLPLSQGEAAYMAHGVSHDSTQTSPVSSQVLGGATDVRGEWTGKRVPGGTLRADEQQTYRKPQGQPAKRAKK